MKGILIAAGILALFFYFGGAGHVGAAARNTRQLLGDLRRDIADRQDNKTNQEGKQV